MIVTHKLTMDIVTREVTPCIHAVQDDRYSRNLELHLYSNSLPYAPGQDCKVLVRYKKPDGTMGLYDTLPNGTQSWFIESNILTVALAPQVCTVAGDVTLWVVLVEGDAELSTFAIRLDVQESIRRMVGSENYLHITGYLPLPAYGEPGQYIRVLRSDDKGTVTAVEAVTLDLEEPANRYVTAHNMAVDAHADIREELGKKADADNLPKVFYINMIPGANEEEFLADKTNAEIDAAYQAGLSVCLVADGMLIPLVMRESETGHIFGGSPYPGVSIMVAIYDDTVMVQLAELVTAERIPESLPNPQKLTFTGSIDAQYDGSEAVTINISADAPDYVLEEADRLAAVVQSHQNANTLSFMVCSDLHTAEKTTTTDYQYTAIAHCGQAMDHIRKQVHIDFAAMLGDMPWDYGETPEMALGTIRKLNQSIAPAFAGIPNFRARGNHDCLYNNATGLTDEQIFSFIGIYNAGAVYDPNNRLGGYCYRDFPEHKLRVICINTCEDNTGNFAVSDAQLSWLDTALDLSGLGEGWHSIVLGHHPPDWVSSTSALVQKLQGAQGLLCVFHGHVHGYKMALIPNTTILRMAIPNACFGRENEYGRNGTTENQEGTEFGEMKTYGKTAGTGEDTAFCVVTLDFGKEIIYADHYGAGYDRAAGFDGFTGTTFTVTNQLTGITTSNTAAIAIGGSTYAASLTWGSSKAITSVTVTMDGEDITETAFYGGHIKIANVTGDIVITAAATDLAGNFTNLVPTSKNFSGTGVFNTTGYFNGCYVSTVSPYRTATDDGSVMTGLLAYPVFGEGNTTKYIPETIYLRGVSFDSTNNHNRIGMFNESYQCTTCPWPGDYLENYYAIDQLGFMYYRLTPIINDAGQNMMAAGNIYCQYIAISANGLGQNMIVTFNQPIV